MSISLSGISSPGEKRPIISPVCLRIYLGASFDVSDTVITSEAISVLLSVLAHEEVKISTPHERTITAAKAEVKYIIKDNILSEKFLRQFIFCLLKSVVIRDLTGRSVVGCLNRQIYISKASMSLSNKIIDKKTAKKHARKIPVNIISPQTAGKSGKNLKAPGIA